MTATHHRRETAPPKGDVPSMMNAEEMHDLFGAPLPSAEERASMKPGDFARIGFSYSARDRIDIGIVGERLWYRVTETRHPQGGGTVEYQGILSGVPIHPRAPTTLRFYPANVYLVNARDA